MCPPGTSAGDLTFTDTTKMRILRKDHPGLGHALNTMVSVLIRDRKKTTRHTKRHKTEAK